MTDAEGVEQPIPSFIQMNHLDGKPATRREDSWFISSRGSYVLTVDGQRVMELISDPGWAVELREGVRSFEF